MPKSKPLGLILIAISFVISSVLAILVGIQSVVLSLSFTLSGAMTLSGMGLILAGVLGLASAYGMFTLAPWGWSLAMFLTVITFPLCAIWLFYDRSQPSLVSNAISVVLSVVILWYLMKPDTKSLFS